MLVLDYRCSRGKCAFPMPPVIRAVKVETLVRRYWYADPVKKLAAECGGAANTLSQRLLRLRKGLRAFLEEKGIRL